MFLRNYDNLLLSFMGAKVQPTTTGASISSGFASNADYNGSLATTSSTTFGDKSNLGDGYINLKKTDGSIGSCKIVTGNSNYYAGVMCPTMMSRGNVCFGDGNTPATYEDYALAGSIIDNTPLVLVSSNTVFNNSTKKFTKTAKYTYTNTTSTDITIKEWGLYSYDYTTTFYKYANNASCTLFYREVLDEPIVIEAGTTATLTFSIDVPMPNHP